MEHCITTIVIEPQLLALKGIGFHSVLVVMKSFISQVLCIWFHLFVSILNELRARMCSYMLI